MKKIRLLLLLLIFPASLWAKERIVRDILITKRYTGERDNISRDHSWYLYVLPNNEVHFRYIYAARGGAIRGTVKKGVLNYENVLKEANKTVYEDTPSAENRSFDGETYRISIYYEDNEGIPESKAIADPSYWNSLIDKIEGNIILNRNAPPADQKVFRREFQNVRLPTPDPQITTEPPVGTKDPVLEVLFGKPKDPILPLIKKETSLKEKPISKISNEVSPLKTANPPSSVKAENNRPEKASQNWMPWAVGVLVMLALAILIRAKLRKA